MYCKNCGAETNGAKYCPSCGAEQTAAPQSPPPQQQYQTYNNTYNAAPPRPVADMTVGEWMVTLLITMIPLVGFICMIVWAVGSDQYKPSRKNWAIANLIWTVIIIVIMVILIAIIGLSVPTTSK